MPSVIRKAHDLNNQIQLILPSCTYYNHEHAGKSGLDGGMWERYNESVFIFSHHDGLQLGSIEATVTTSWTHLRAFCLLLHVEMASQT